MTDPKPDLSSVPIVNATKMVISVMATTNAGRQLSEAEWKAVEHACDVCFELDAAKRTILEYVESRMNLLAPNLSAIIGARTATKLLGMAGGLSGLATVPACNIYARRRCIRPR